MEAPLRDALTLNLVHSHGIRVFCLVECIGIEGLVGNDVVLQKSLQVLLTVGREEESVDLGAELLECPV